MDLDSGNRARVFSLWKVQLVSQSVVAMYTCIRDGRRHAYSLSMFCVG